MVPYWYIAAIRNCLQSGEMLAVSERGVVRGVVKGRGLARTLGGGTILVHSSHQELSSEWRDVSSK